MFNEMKVRPHYTPEQVEEIRAKWLAELQPSRTARGRIKGIKDLIHRLEDGAADVNDVMQDKDVNGQYSPSLQSVFDDIMDILDYLKSYDNPLTDTEK